MEISAGSKSESFLGWMNSCERCRTNKARRHRSTARKHGEHDMRMVGGGEHREVVY